MMIYRLDYVLATDWDGIFSQWPAARAYYGLDESYQYSSEEIGKYVYEYLKQSEWFCSRREAVVRRLELFKAGKLHGRKNDHPIAMVDMPTRKREIVQWLNERKIK